MQDELKRSALDNQSIRQRLNELLAERDSLKADVLAEKSAAQATRATAEDLALKLEATEKVMCGHAERGSLAQAIRALHMEHDGLRAELLRSGGEVVRAEEQRVHLESLVQLSCY